jgi:hypothetical protein
VFAAIVIESFSIRQNISVVQLVNIIITKINFLRSMPNFTKKEIKDSAKLEQTS